MTVTAGPANAGTTIVSSNGSFGGGDIDNDAGFSNIATFVSFDSFFDSVDLPGLDIDNGDIEASGVDVTIG
jgi:hypothetical protein